MHTVPNQKVVTIHKEPCNKSNLYCTINLDALRAASAALTSGGLALWLFYASNQNGYTFATGNTLARETMGIKKDAYDRATGELIRLGYLTHKCGNCFTFNEKPISPKVEDKPDNHVEVKAPEAQEVKPTRNNIPIQEDNTDNLPPIDLRWVQLHGINNYTIDGDIITFETGKRCRLQKGAWPR